ncbi:MAG TPA: hypothetical protein VJH22_04810 [Candidatus Nanoarchaeia archaeon]|nr:hypothetical protein [Candidatus Nanoarchaeia archaeon]
MLHDNPKNVRRRKRNEAKRKEEQRQALEVWKQPLTTQKQQPLASPPISLDQVLSHALVQFEHFYPIAKQSIPDLPDIDACRNGFIEMVRLNYNALPREKLLPVVETRPQDKRPPLYLPANWRETLKHPDPHSRVRGSSMVVKLGMCGIRGFLEDVFRSNEKVRGDYRPNRAMQRGKRAHEDMHTEERQASYSLHRKTDCRLLIKLENLCDPYPGLVYLEEKEFQSEIDYKGVKIPVTGTPDRILSAGGDSPIFILEGKTDLFKSSLIMGYIGQALIYGKVVYDWLKANAPEQAKKRKIYTLLTESLEPLDENDMAPLAEGHPAGFLKKMQTYAQRKHKVLLVQEYGFLQHAFVHGLIHTTIEARGNPYILQGPTNLDICGRCPWSERDCDTYKQIKQSQSL